MLALQHGDGHAVGAPVRKEGLGLGGVTPTLQLSPITQNPIEEAEHFLPNRRGFTSFLRQVSLDALSSGESTRFLIYREEVSFYKLRSMGNESPL